MWMILFCVQPSVAGTAFTYQGELHHTGSPANGFYTLRFSLWNAANGGTQIGTTIQMTNMVVTDGKFTATLDWGPVAFEGDRWVEVRVNATTLTPRQPVGSAPRSTKTRGVYVNEDESFVGIGRSYRITSAERFGIHYNTTSFGGMYVETAEGGRPFYGYSTLGSVDAYHYYDSASNQWRLWVGSDRMVVDGDTGNVGIGTTSPNHDLQIVGDGSQSLVRLTNGGGSGQANTALIIGDVTNTGRAASVYGITTSDLFDIHNDGAGNALQVSSGGAGHALDVIENGGGIAVRAINNATSGSAYGVFAASSSSSGIGMYGQGKVGAYGFSSIGGFDGKGIYGVCSATHGVGVHGHASSGDDSAGVLGTNSGGGWAGFFQGDARVTGTFLAGSKNFIIDNPLNPAEEYLYHASIESDAMRNLYDGTVVLNAMGEAVVQLPEWFDALNAEYRYQLTCIGGHAPVYVSREIENNQFTIAGGPEGQKVCWQVTGVRIDPAAREANFKVIKPKSATERGTYLCPEGYGQPATKRAELTANRTGDE